MPFSFSIICIMIVHFVQYVVTEYFNLSVVHFYRKTLVSKLTFQRISVNWYFPEWCFPLLTTLMNFIQINWLRSRKMANSGEYLELIRTIQKWFMLCVRNLIITCLFVSCYYLKSTLINIPFDKITGKCFAKPWHIVITFCIVILLFSITKTKRCPCIARVVKTILKN